MSTKLFVNLPVQDLKRSMEFFQAAGFQFNPQFTDETAACMVLSEHNYIMLLTHEKFREFSRKTIIDARSNAEVIVSLSTESREEVEMKMAQILQAGGTEPSPAKDYGFMYQRSFEDLDGHHWEIFFMDMSAVPQPE